MSMIRCEGCSRSIDSDDDPDCFVEHPAHPINGAPDIVLCEPCRDRREQEPDGPAEAIEAIRDDLRAIMEGRKP